MVGRPTIYEVARRSEVSTATVSRVMCNGSGFSETTRKRVLAAAAELGWVPNGSAQGLAVRQAGIVGLLFPGLRSVLDPDSESPLFADQVIRGAEHAAARAGKALLLVGARGPAGPDLVASITGKVDGLVVLARSLSDRQLVAIAGRLPVVVVAARGARRRMDLVTADNRGGAAAMTAHLLVDHGYRDTVFIAGPARSPDSEERFAGYRQTLQDANCPVPDAPDAVGAFTEGGGALAMQQILDSRSRPPRAVVAGNDEMAIGALAVLRRRGLRVPADVAVTGFDDISAGRHLRPTLSTVHQPMQHVGERAVEILTERLREPKAPRRTLMLPTRLTLRRSCGCRGGHRSTAGRRAW